jgi:glycine/D-amino acid oxidase-like deaminating enzyme
VLQQKGAFPDPARAIPRDLPFTIDVDPQMIDWNNVERNLLLADTNDRRFALEMPGAIHCRPEGGDIGTWIKLGRAYNATPSEAEHPPHLDPRFPAIVLCGAARLHAGLKAYYSKLPRQMVHYGGYSTKTSDNWPLIGPVGPAGAFKACGLSGHGTMAACATGELAVTWMTGTGRPSWSSNFTLDRFSNPLVRPLETQRLL